MKIKVTRLRDSEGEFVAAPEGAEDVALTSESDTARAWWEVPLPACPDCGGDLLWYEAGWVPGVRKCTGHPVSVTTYDLAAMSVYDPDGGCGAMFMVDTVE